MVGPPWLSATSDLFLATHHRLPVGRPVEPRLVAVNAWEAAICL